MPRLAQHTKPKSQGQSNCRVVYGRNCHRRHKRTACFCVLLHEYSIPIRLVYRLLALLHMQTVKSQDYPFQLVTPGPGYHPNVRQFKTTSVRKFYTLNAHTFKPVQTEENLHGLFACPNHQICPPSVIPNDGHILISY
jgi:hypothetical protein